MHIICLCFDLTALDALLSEEVCTCVLLMRPGIGQNVPCALSDCLTSGTEGCLWPRELWLLIFMYVHGHSTLGVLSGVVW